LFDIEPISKISLDYKDFKIIMRLSNLINTSISSSKKQMYLNEFLPLLIETERNKARLEYLTSQFITIPIKNIMQQNIRIPAFEKNIQTNGIIMPENMVYNDQNIRIPDFEKNIQTHGIIMPENMVYNGSYYFKNDKNIITEFNKNKTTNNFNIVEQNNCPFNDDLFDYELVQNITEDIIPYNDCSIYADYSTYNNENLNNNKNDKQMVIVLYNHIISQTIVLTDPNEEELRIVFYYPEYGFIHLFALYTDNKELTQYIIKEYDGICFNDINDLNRSLSSTSGFIVYSSKHFSVNINKEETVVTEYFKKYYIIDGDVSHRMKASTIYDIIVKSAIHKKLDLTNAGFKNRLSKYLINMGLKKKRYNDGYYYYGIIAKNTLDDPISSANLEYPDVLKEFENMHNIRSK
jgi:hypothetical protein